MSESCPTCGRSDPEPGEPVQIVTRLVVNDKELARAVNRWNDEHRRGDGPSGKS